MSSPLSHQIIETHFVGNVASAEPRLSNLLKVEEEIKNLGKKFGKYISSGIRHSSGIPSGTQHNYFKHYAILTLYHLTYLLI